MKLYLTGLNHTTAPVEIRERLAFEPAKLGEAVAELRRIPGLAEGIILSTCNRVEVAATLDSEEDAGDAFVRFLADSRGVPPDTLRPLLYAYEDRDAIRHLFRVASSLDSMVVGEPQILGQLKAAYETARACGTVGGFLDSVITRAFSVAKRVRSETGIGHSAVSVSYAAVELARQIFGSLTDRRVMLIGAGKTSELAARHLERAGAREILVTNRSPERAQQVAELFHGRVVEYTSFVNRLPEVDVVIASSGAPHFVLRKEEMRRVIGARRNRPMFLIDIAVPRNIEPAVHELDNVYLYDIDDLQRVVESNLAERRSEALTAEQIVSEEVERMMSRLRARAISPMIVDLQQQLELIRQGELDRVRGRLAALTPQQMEAVEALTRGIVNKIAHAPIAEMRREAANPQAHHFFEAVRRLFRLGG